MDLVMNNSISLVGIVTALFLGVRTVIDQMKKRKLTLKEYALSVYTRFLEQLDLLAFKILAVMVLTVVISIVLFRDLWDQDVFQVAIIVSLLKNKVEELAKKVLYEVQ